VPFVEDQVDFLRGKVMCFEPGAPFFPFGGVEGFHRRMMSGLR